MMKKKLEVVELNKQDKNIIIKEHPNAWKKFWKKYNKIFLPILFILSIAILTTSLIITISNISTSDKLIIKEASIDTDLDVTSADVTATTPLTDETAKEIFKNSGTFKRSGEVLLVKTVSKGKYIIKFYSDYTAIKQLKKGGGVITKINSIDGKSYGIKENGDTNPKAETLDITIIEIKEFSWGKVKYYSDGSAEISNSNMDMYVRNAEDINENYISNNKLSYLKETKNLKGTKLNYYYDGTIEIIKNNTRYLVRNSDDLTITDDNVYFKYDNEATIKETIKLDKGVKINYYTDGSAIIVDGNKKLSVRKSNSIIIKDNKIYEIVDNIYVTVSKTSNNGNIIYYTNGSAVIKNYNGTTIYVKENSDIKYENGRIISVGNNYEKLTEEKNLNGDKVLVFETTAVVETKDFIAIIDKNKILYNTDGSFKEILTEDVNSGDKPITITNSTNDTIKYRLVIEKSNKTNLDVEYIKYQLQVKNTYIEPTKLNTKLWKQDEVSNVLAPTGTNYILVERTLEPMETDQIRLMLWTDYDRIPNSMQDKYFYGTIRIYAWQEVKLDV